MPPITHFTLFRSPHNTSVHFFILFTMKASGNCPDLGEVAIELEVLTLMENWGTELDYSTSDDESITINSLPDMLEMTESSESDCSVAEHKAALKTDANQEIYSSAEEEDDFGDFTGATMPATNNLKTLADEDEFSTFFSGKSLSNEGAISFPTKPQTTSSSADFSFNADFSLSNC